MGDVAAIRAGKAAVEISGDDRKLKEATDRSKKYLADLAQASKQTAGEGQKGFLASLAQRARGARMEARSSGENALSSALSSGGGMSQFAAQSLGIGLPVAVAETLGRGLKDASDKAMELRKQLKEGKITWEEWSRSFAESIPVVGGFVGFFMNIRELLTGEKAEIEEINKETARTNAINEASVKIIRMYRDALYEVQVAAAKAAIATEAIGKGQYYAEGAQIAAARIDLQKQREIAQKGKDEELNKDAEPKLQALRERVKIEEDKLEKTKVYDPDREFREIMVKNAKRDYENAVNNLQQKKNAIKEAGLAAVDQEEAKLNAQADDLNKRYGIDWQRTRQDAMTATDRMAVEEYATRMRYLDKEGDAEIAMLKQQAREREIQITRAAEDQAQKLGAVGPGDPKRKELLGIAADEVRKLHELTDAQENAINQRTYEKKRKEALDLQKLQAQAIQNRHEQELKLLDEEYQAEMDAATRAGRDTAQIKARWDQDRANKVQQQALEVADAQREMDLDVEKTRIELGKRGLAQRLAELAVERREALRREADPRTTTGVGADRINQLYDLRTRMEASRARSSAGSFAVREIARMGGTGNRLDDIASHTKETARNTRKLVQQKPAFSPG